MKILISGYTGLGNIILKIPLIETCKKYYPEADIDIITGNTFGIEEILQGNPFIRTLHVIPKTLARLKKIKKLYDVLKKETYDVLFMPFDTKDIELLIASFLTRLPRRVMHLHWSSSKYKMNIHWLLPNTVYVPILPGHHEIDLNLDLFEAFYQKPIERHYETKLFASPQPSMLNEPYIIIQVGAANGTPSPKRWPIHSFSELMTRLHQDFPAYKLVTVGDKQDYESCIKPLESAHPYIHNTAGKTTIPELMGLIQNAALTIAHDSGVMHLTNALDKPLIALYGPTDYTRTRPLGLHSKILFSKNETFAAMYNFQTTEYKLAQLYPENYCMSTLGVDDVYQAIKDHLHEQ